VGRIKHETEMPKLNFLIIIQVILRFCAFPKKFSKIFFRNSPHGHIYVSVIFLFWHLANVDPAKRYSPRAGLVNFIILCTNLFDFEQLGEKKNGVGAFMSAFGSEISSVCVCSCEHDFENLLQFKHKKNYIRCIYFVNRGGFFGN